MCHCQERSVVVIDVGSSTCRAGFAREEAPSVVMPTVLGYPRHLSCPANSCPCPANMQIKSSHVGEEARRMRDLLDLVYPVVRGCVANWDDMETFLQHTFLRELKIDPCEHAVLMSEPLQTPYKDRERMHEVLFETFQVPAVYVELQPVLGMYAGGCVTSVVVASGDGLTQVLPIYEGRAIREAIVKQELAGCDITDYLAKLLLQKSNVRLDPGFMDDVCVLEDIKAKLCYVAQDFRAEWQHLSCLPPRCICAPSTSYSLPFLSLPPLSCASLSPGSCPCPQPEGPTPYTLPDGRTVVVGGDVRIETAEAMFNPEHLLGRDLLGLPEAIYTSVMRSPIDTRADLFGMTVLSGGNTLFPGLPQRVQRDVARRNAGSTRVRVRDAEGRAHHVWAGGSILGALTLFGEMLLDRRVYEEVGPSAAIYRCCLALRQV